MMKIEHKIELDVKNYLIVSGSFFACLSFA